MFSDTSEKGEVIEHFSADARAFDNELTGQNALQALQHDRQRHNSTQEQATRLFGTVSLHDGSPVESPGLTKSTAVEAASNAASTATNGTKKQPERNLSSNDNPKPNPFDPESIKNDPEFEKLRQELKKVEWTGPLVGGTGIHGEDLSVGQYSIMKDGTQLLALHNGDKITIQKDGSYSLKRWDGENSDANPSVEAGTKNGVTTLKYGDGAVVRFNQYGPLEVFQPFVAYSGGGGLHWQREL